MITEDYCSYEVAKLLKEKGFEGDINAYYHIWDNGNRVCSVQEFNHSEAPHLYIPAPTHQMAMKWLREKHNIHISVTIGCDVDNSNYIFYWAGIAKFTESSVDYIDPFEDAEFKSYEEAVEAALKYVLENLI